MQRHIPAIHDIGVLRCRTTLRRRWFIQSHDRDEWNARIPQPLKCGYAFLMEADPGDAQKSCLETTGHEATVVRDRCFVNFVRTIVQSYAAENPVFAGC